MERQKCIIISPDYDVLYSDEEGCCYSAFGDEIHINNPELGPRFSIVIPGIEEWLKRYENATDFAETTTDPSFDWKVWHYEGLCFAKAIREQLPKYYTLYYESPYEDKTNTIPKTEINDNIDNEINKLKPESGSIVTPLSFKDNVTFDLKRASDSLSVSFMVGKSKTDVIIQFDRLAGIKLWLKQIIEGGNSTCCLNLPGHNLYFFKQTVGSHPEMGEFWIIPSGKHDAVFQSYVNIREFIKGVYLALMNRLGFGLYNSIHYPTVEERKRIWTPYNSLKSGIIESFISGQSIDDFSIEEAYHINETFVMFPDYGGCIFWDTMGVGSGDFDEILSDSGNLKIDVQGLKKWSSFYDNHDDSQSFDDYWEEGWELAKLVRKQIPENIDLYYMCYDPNTPEKYVDYNCALPSVIVPIK